ncbi:host-nuclease inhibitor Gam family protein [Rhodobacter capsulatus]|jgi:phage host-nuclease inhibitor protein Gam|uniref:Host-nuclease inhibitor protein Gam n=1 Tax=Rhodobacter capsulatus (strain ATCC BAA-309 / NBRC 16581 / SB1003) TaxID=272942 RepID=D5AQV5_RHOCB|nr:host-nuclease inhibitor Gam family protein [Rhodobacter capsulatus]YP_004934662.1 Mu Gam-like end protection [Rhodobacter phage RcapMu]ADE84761.1 host-nuclease inhibitor protein Gam [Rhodobacter capsulatus SB 1003]AER29942.1 host-nuclease inhibitor Gam [Rhodobacter phage RcapMu]ETD02231.1 host-nuclease inhibitor protein Gam [Rhodobacter capsulatus DE442]ETD78314.1 host-nuclease inhibitor protein Gam [Rhodobacter capsulatus R121]ETE54429.1 host-nuclease inhibitor protein Gam [Rhodobacter ca
MTVSNRSKKTKTKASALPIPQDDSEARSAIREIGDLNRKIARAEADLNDEIAALQEKYGTLVEPLRAEIEAKTEGLKMFCEVNRDRLTRGNKVKFARFTTGEISWKLRPAKVTIRKVDEVLATIKKLGLAAQFIRTKEELNKEAMLANRQLAKTIAGVTIGSDGEDFIVEPFETELPEGV